MSRVYSEKKPVEVEIKKNIYKFNYITSSVKGGHQILFFAVKHVFFQKKIIPKLDVFVEDCILQMWLKSPENFKCFNGNRSSDDGDEFIF